LVSICVKIPYISRIVKNTGFDSKNDSFFYINNFRDSSYFYFLLPVRTGTTKIYLFPTSYRVRLFVGISHVNGLPFLDEKI
jgi:hypothetical protein